MMDIKGKLDVLSKESFIQVQLGPTPWWNTRLFLVAALAQAFGQPKGIVLLTDKQQFLMMASPGEIRYRLAKRWPKLEKAYADFRKDSPTLEAISEELWRYPESVRRSLKSDEQDARHVLSQQDMEYELGIARNAEVVDPNDKSQRFLQREILGRQTPFVALVRNGALEGVVDRNFLAQRIAQAALT